MRVRKFMGWLNGDNGVFATLSASLLTGQRSTRIFGKQTTLDHNDCSFATKTALLKTEIEDKLGYQTWVKLKNGL